MSPILLERSDLFKLTFAIVAVLPALFVSGFIYGYTKAESHQETTRLSLAMRLPDLSTAVNAEREPAVPDTLTAGHDRDVDAVDDEEGMRHQHVAAMDAGAGTVDEAPAPVAAAAAAQPELRSAAALGVGGPHETADIDPVELMLDTADEDSARYSVQVGLFGSADNAERKVESLLAMRLNAYTSSYTRKDESRMHNVRFGYFDQRKDALAALESYRETFSADGYIISLKR